MFGIESKSKPIRGKFAKEIMKVLSAPKSEMTKKSDKPKKKIFNYDGIVFR